MAMAYCMFCAHDNPPGLRRCRNCGADLPEATGPGMSSGDDLESRVRSLMAEGQKIEAIKLYRERTGAGLKESKDAVEAIQRGQSAPAVPASDRDFEAELVALLERGQKIGAIKLYRERTGVGLKDAKDAVESLAERRGGVISQRAGCLGVIAVLLALLAGALAFA
jgi:ribosomal protein L7/L12